MTHQEATEGRYVEYTSGAVAGFLVPAVGPTGIYWNVETVDGVSIYDIDLKEWSIYKLKAV